MKDKTTWKDSKKLTGNLVSPPSITSFMGKNGVQIVANFTLVVTKPGEKAQYYPCCAYGKKSSFAKNLIPGDLLYVFGREREVEASGRTYEDLVVYYFQKVQENQEEKEK